jgi:3-hydroxyacyl-[acyl-carrier-protein] dehydratase
MINIQEIKKVLRHRYPFLMIDRVLHRAPGKKATGLKNVTINEPFFTGHFPESPIVPGVLIVESIAQLVAFLSEAENDKVALLSSIYDAKFFRPVIPGDQMIITVEVTQQVRNLLRVKGAVEVDGQRVAKAEMGLMIFDQNEFMGKGK